MKWLKIILKLLLGILVFPVVYLLVSLLLTSITVNENNVNLSKNKMVYLNTNGVHLDIIIPVSEIDDRLIKGLKMKGEKYLSFGWGDENFYLNTPTWNDLTFKNAFSALFLNSSTLIHLTKYSNKKSEWTIVHVNEKQLSKLNEYILNSFELNINGDKIILENVGYSFNDAFYKAKGKLFMLKNL
ncbi:DUF2459 domain-containing protein [Flaviramulus sp. BrNp1-15]|uniref:DUF2459 domain-containing protein n=1 Tax=Flaviramulus sp. BrNp1-15 TaxID=2916754 RepID=UPI001EE8BFBF|nr:DUF2459 domain-containing protein [Flaviramulus sp. BrNp1-15]ULC59151.1 DUF2459 domain-containing protein [Flaviramulus sp. BrNp1-15]